MRGTIFYKKMKLKTRLDIQNPETRMAVDSLKGEIYNVLNKKTDECLHNKIYDLKNNAIFAFINHAIKRREIPKTEPLVFLRI